MRFFDHKAVDETEVDNSLHENLYIFYVDYAKQVLKHTPFAIKAVGEDLDYLTDLLRKAAMLNSSEAKELLDDIHSSGVLEWQNHHHDFTFGF